MSKLTKLTDEIDRVMESFGMENTQGICYNCGKKSKKKVCSQCENSLRRLRNMVCIKR